MEKEVRPIKSTTSTLGRPKFLEVHTPNLRPLIPPKAPMATIHGTTRQGRYPSTSRCTSDEDVDSKLLTAEVEAATWGSTRSESRKGMSSSPPPMPMMEATIPAQDMTT